MLVRIIPNESNEKRNVFAAVQGYLLHMSIPDLLCAESLKRCLHTQEKYQKKIQITPSMLYTLLSILHLIHPFQMC